MEETRAYRDIFSKGEAKEKQEGEAEAKAEPLLRLLRRRFGTVPDWAELRIASASLARVDAWLDGIFDADGVTGNPAPETPETDPPPAPSATDTRRRRD